MHALFYKMKKIFVIGLITFCVTPLTAQKNGSAPEIGIVQNLENDSLLHACGYGYLVESIAKRFSPKNVTDQQFEEELKVIRKLKTRLYACNIFIPGELKVVGPVVDEGSILSFAEAVFKRCHRAKVKLIVWGSAGARRLPDGFDRAKARVQLIAIARKLSELAKKYKIVIALENLNRTETNFINTLEEAYDIVQQVDRPNFRLCADIYHMLKENEPPAIIEKAQQYIVHCDLAEKENRTPPGTIGDDFREYLKALNRIGYKGKIVMECRWENLARQATPSREALQKQINEAYGQKVH